MHSPPHRCSFSPAFRFVVTANLAIAGLTRLSVVYRFRRHISARRSLSMAAASVPGLYVGVRLLSEVSESTIRVLAGCAVMVTVALLARSLDRPPPEPIPGAPLAAAGLSALALEGALSADALYPAVIVWLPGAMAGNLLGTVVAPRLPERLFRRLVLAVLFAAGAVTAVSGWES
jgi:uncharacterized protein